MSTHQVDLHWIPIDAPDQDERITMGDWSPDGNEIVFMSDRAGVVQLWIVDVATGITRQLSDHELPWSTHAGDTQAGPRWAPDGSVIGYLAPGQDGNAIWLIEPDGSNRRESTVRDAFSFGWYKDGQRVVYTRRAPDGSGQVELRAAHLGTGEDVLLFAGALSEVSVSPDGSALTYISSVSHFTMELQMLRLAPTSEPNSFLRRLVSHNRSRLGTASRMCTAAAGRGTGAASCIHGTETTAISTSWSRIARSTPQ